MPMKKLYFISCLLVALTSAINANAKSGTSGGDVVAGVAIGASARNVAIANSNIQESDCAACHVEIFPFKEPDTCVLSRGTDCWEKNKLNDDVTIMTRKDMKIKTLYRLFVRYRPFRYFLPATEGTRNPHFVLEEQE